MNSEQFKDVIKSYSDIFEEQDEKFNSLIESKENIKNLFNEYTYFCKFILDAIQISIEEDGNLNYIIYNIYKLYENFYEEYDIGLYKDNFNIDKKYSLNFSNSSRFTNNYFQKLFYVISKDEELINFLIKKYKINLMEKELKKVDG